MKQLGGRLKANFGCVRPEIPTSKKTAHQKDRDRAYRRDGLADCVSSLYQSYPNRHDDGSDYPDPDLYVSAS